MTYYSYRALWNRFMHKENESWIRLCDNNCGAKTYFDVLTGKVRNAEVNKNDSKHSDTCSQIKAFKQMAASLNWIPSYTFEYKDDEVDISLNKILDFCLDTFNKEREIYQRTETVKTRLDARMEFNAEVKRKWDKDKKDQWNIKKQTKEWKDEEEDQLRQWNAFLMQEKDPNHPHIPEPIKEKGRSRNSKGGRRFQ